jgi:hypothetical protein
MLDLKEKIDSYLTGDLSDSERISFESSMASDPSFKAEVDFQKDVIDGLKEYRKAQLKARLNNIDVSSGSGSSTLFKFAASIITAATVGAGIIYLTSTNDQPKTETPVVAITETNQSSSEITNSESQTNENALTPVSDLAKKDKKKKGNAETKETATPSPSKDLTKPVEPNFNLPAEHVASSEDFNGGQIDVPSGDVAKSAVKNVKGIDAVSINDKNTKDLSYQYYNNKLYLFGDFNARPYELIEYNSNRSPRLFIKFDGAFYELRNNQTKATPMKEVTDSDLLDQLKHLNKK